MLAIAGVSSTLLVLFDFIVILLTFKFYKNLRILYSIRAFSFLKISQVLKYLFAFL